jgi:hypothetical protein
VYLGESAREYYNCDQKNIHDTKISEYMGIINDTYNNEYLILSPEFITLFDDFGRSCSDAWDDYFPSDYLSFAAVVRKYRPLLLEQGRKEVSEIPFSWSKLWKWRRPFWLKLPPSKS